MRTVESMQIEIGATAIENIVIDPKSRDDIPPLLLGLQHLHATAALREQVLALLEAHVSPAARKDTGRPGMHLWRILALAILKQGLDTDYDRLTRIASHDTLARQMLGHGQLTEFTCGRQTVIDNVRLLSPQLLESVSDLLVGAGRRVVKKKPGDALRGRADSFVVETSVHFPTAQNLLWDAMRCAVR